MDELRTVLPAADIDHVALSVAAIIHHHFHYNIERGERGERGEWGDLPLVQIEIQVDSPPKKKEIVPLQSLKDILKPVDGDDVFCSICQGTQGGQSCETWCNHRFCISCIETHLNKYRAFCPLCNSAAPAATTTVEEPHAIRYVSVIFVSQAPPVSQAAPAPTTTTFRASVAETPMAETETATEDPAPVVDDTPMAEAHPQKKPRPNDE